MKQEATQQRPSRTGIPAIHGGEHVKTTSGTPPSHPRPPNPLPEELVRMSNRKIDPAEIHFDENTAVEVADLENEEYYVEGERLTEESAQRLAAEMLERVRAKNLRPGGKSLSGGNKHSPVVQVRVSERTRDKLQAIADARGMSVSKLSRKVLDEFVKRETLEQ